MRPTFIDSAGKADLAEWLTSSYPKSSKYIIQDSDGEALILQHPPNNAGLWVNHRRTITSIPVIRGELRVLFKTWFATAVMKAKRKATMAMNKERAKPRPR